MIRLKPLGRGGECLRFKKEIMLYVPIKIPIMDTMRSRAVKMLKVHGFIESISAAEQIKGRTDSRLISGNTLFPLKRDSSSVTLALSSNV